MSTEITKDIICPQCGEPQKYRLFAGVNAQDNPELKEKILEETLFDWRCQRCNYFAAMAYPFLYTDPEKKLLVCVTPAGSKPNVQPSPAVEEFTKRQVKNLAELKEKILIFDGGYDDVAVELVKNALCTIIKDSYKVNRVHAYFSRVNQDEMEFAIFLPRKAEPVYHSTKLDVYKQSQEVLRTLDFVDPPGFVVADAKLARKIIEEYQDI